MQIETLHRNFEGKKAVQLLQEILQFLYDDNELPCVGPSSKRF